MNPVKHFLSALGFLTIIPLNYELPFEPQKMMPFFPVIGGLIGFIIATLDLFLRNIFSVHIASLFDVLSFVVITGALHLDGLADTADGLFSHTTKEETLKIMKDSRLGTMGAVTVFFVLTLKWVFISELSYNIRFFVLLLVPAFSRGSMVLATQFLPYCRNAGLGKKFVEKLSLKNFLPFGLIIVVSIPVFKLKFFNILIAFVFTMSILLYIYHKKLNCITGDMLGALNEIMEVSLFLSLII